MGKQLTDTDYENAANDLCCDIAAIRAVAEVESRGDGFLSDGRLKVLFEGHQFHKYTKGSFAHSHPALCYAKWTRDHYAKGPNSEARGAGELARLEAAMALDRNAALLSTSYGKFQIMGFNFALCGYPTVDDFYEAMQVSESEHLRAFCAYITAVGLDDELLAHDWGSFARRYNGPEYKKNLYDAKLAAAYAKHAGVA